MRGIIVSFSLFFSLFSALDSLAQSQPSPPADPEKGATQQQIGPEDFPVLVKMPPTERSTADSEAEAEDRQIEAALDKRFVDITDNLANYTLWLVLVTGLLVVVTGGLVRLGFRQERMTKITSRAYLSVEPQGIDRWRSQNDRVLGHVGVRNTGHLPARAVTWTLHIEFDNDGERANFPIGNRVRKGPVITPGMTMRRGTPNIPPETQKYCYVWGRIRYDNGLAIERHTDFCHRYNCEIKSFVNVRRINARHARYHDFGNDAN